MLNQVFKGGTKMALDITVEISVAEVAGNVGFGIPLVLVSKGENAVPYTECTSLVEVKALYGEDTDPYKIAKLIWKQTNAPTRIAFYSSTSDATTAIAEVVSKDWRQLIVVIGEGDTATPATIAEYIKTTNKMYFVTAKTAEELTAVKGNDRVVAFYYNLKKDDEDEYVEPYAVSALVGEVAGRTVGSYTYKNLILKGLEPLELNDNEVSEIHTGGGITLLRKAGDVVTSEGKTTNGEYVDIIDGNDWIIYNIKYQGQKLLNNSSKIPYTDNGIAALESTVANVLQEAFVNGIIATAEDGVSPLYSTNFKKRAEVSTADRTGRTYTGGNFAYHLAGAIHTAEINGELVI